MKPNLALPALAAALLASSAHARCNDDAVTVFACATAAGQLRCAGSDIVQAIEGIDLKPSDWADN